jgi:hypothetical protein
MPAIQYISDDDEEDLMAEAQPASIKISKRKGVVGGNGAAGKKGVARGSKEEQEVKSKEIVDTEGSEDELSLETPKPVDIATIKALAVGDGVDGDLDAEGVRKPTNVKQRRKEALRKITPYKSTPVPKKKQRLAGAADASGTPVPAAKGRASVSRKELEEEFCSPPPSPHEDKWSRDEDEEGEGCATPRTREVEGRSRETTPHTPLKSLNLNLSTGSIGGVGASGKGTGGSTGMSRYRVGMSRRSRVPSLLKIIKK